MKETARACKDMSRLGGGRGEEEAREVEAQMEKEKEIITTPTTSQCCRKVDDPTPGDALLPLSRRLPSCRRRYPFCSYHLSTANAIGQPPKPPQPTLRRCYPPLSTWCLTSLKCMHSVRTPQQGHPTRSLLSLSLSFPYTFAPFNPRSPTVATTITTTTFTTTTTTSTTATTTSSPPPPPLLLLRLLPPPPLPPPPTPPPPQCHHHDHY